MRWIIPVVFSLVLASGGVAPAFATCLSTGVPDRDGRSTVLPGYYFRDRDLSGLDLTGFSRDGADFTGANLTGTVLAGAVVRYSSFNGANLDKASLYGSLVRGSEMIGATLTNVRGGHTGFGDVLAPGATLQCSEFTASEFDRAIFTGANFINANLTGSTAVSADFTGANFTGARLAGVDLSKAVLRNANLTRTNLTNAKLTGATWVDGTVCGTGSIGTCNPAVVTGAPDLAVAAIRPRPGLWRAVEGDTGYLFEAAGSGLRLIVVGFDGQGNPSWSVAEGQIDRDNVFTSDLRRCAGPSACNTDLGPITVSFTSPASASLLAPGAMAVAIAPSSVH